MKIYFYKKNLRRKGWIFHIVSVDTEQHFTRKKVSNCWNNLQSEICCLSIAETLMTKRKRMMTSQVLRRTVWIHSVYWCITAASSVPDALLHLSDVLLWFTKAFCEKTCHKFWLSCFLQSPGVTTIHFVWTRWVKWNWNVTYYQSINKR